MATIADTIELARDADNRIALTPEQAAALAEALATRNYDVAEPLRMAIIHDADNPDRALARYVLATRNVVAAAVAQTEAEAEMNREDAIGSPWSQAAARKRRNDATDTLIAAVRAAGLATEAVAG